MTVTRQYARNTQNEDGAGGPIIFDLSATSSSGGETQGTGNTQSEALTEFFRWQRTVGDSVIGTSFPTRIVVSANSGGRFQWRIQRYNSSGVLQATSDLSTIQSSANTFDQTLTLSTTWAAGDRLALSFWFSRQVGGMGNASATVDVGAGDSGTWADADLAGGTGATVTPTTVAAVASVGTPTLAAGSTITPATVAAAATVPTPTVTTTGGATITPATVAAAASIPTPIIPGATVVWDGQVVTWNGDTVTWITAAAGATVTPSTVAAVATIPAPTVSAGSAITAATVQATALIPALEVAVGVTVSPTTVAAAATVPTPTVTTGGGGGGISDNFNRANETLTDGPWAVSGGNWSVISNQCLENATAGKVVARHTTALSSSDMRSEAKYVDGVGGLTVRGSSDLQSCYMCFAYGGNLREFWKRTGGTNEFISDIGSIAISSGDTIYMEAEGSTLRIGKVGGSELSITDTSITTGTYAGLVSDSVIMDDFAAQDLGAGGDATVTPGVVAVVASIGAPTVSGAALVVATAVAAVATVGSPTVAAGSGAAPATVSAAASIGSPTVSTGSVVSPSAVAATASVPTPAVSAGGSAAVTPAAVSAAATVPAVTVSAAAVAAPATVSVTATIGGATIGAGATITPATIAAVASVPTPAVSAGGSATVSPAVVSATATISAPTVSTGVTIAAATVAATATVPAVTVRLGALIQPTTVAATVTVPAVTVIVGGGATVEPAAVAAVTTIPAVSLRTDVTLAPATVLAVATVPAPEVTAGEPDLNPLHFAYTEQARHAGYIELVTHFNYQEGL